MNWFNLAKIFVALVIVTGLMIVVIVKIKVNDNNRFSLYAFVMLCGEILFLALSFLILRY